MKMHNYKVSFFAKSEEEAVAKLKEFAKMNPPVVTYKPIRDGEEKNEVKNEKESLSEIEKDILCIGKKIFGMIEMLEFASKDPSRMEFLIDLFPSINLKKAA